MSGSALALLAFAIMVVTMALWIRAIRSVSVPENRIGYVVACAAALLIGAAAWSASPGWLGGTVAGLSIFAAFFFLLTAAIGGQKFSADAIQVGDTIPAFSAPDDQGENFDSTQLAGQPALIKFFRGHW